MPPQYSSVEDKIMLLISQERKWTMEKSKKFPSRNTSKVGDFKNDREYFKYKKRLRDHPLFPMLNFDIFLNQNTSEVTIFCFNKY